MKSNDTSRGWKGGEGGGEGAADRAPCATLGAVSLILSSSAPCPHTPYSPAPSPMTKPSRCLSQGREARSGSSLRLLSACQPMSEHGEHGRTGKGDSQGSVGSRTSSWIHARMPILPCKNVCFAM
jgi:hypothetical protein